MAGKSPGQPTFSAEDMRLARLQCIYAKVVTKVLHSLLVMSTPDKSPGISFLEYYGNKVTEIDTLKKKFFLNQQEKMDKDLTGESFDITLLYACLRRGCHGLASEKDTKWKEGNDSLESHITDIKSNRNKIAHDHPALKNHQFIKEIHELRRALTTILRLSGELYQIPAVTINQKIADMDLSINQHQDDDLAPQDFEDYKKQLLYQEQCKFVNKKGVEDALQQYDKSSEGMINTVNHIDDISFPLDDVYTDMRLQKELTSGHEIPTSYKEILEDESQNECDCLICIFGVAGVGKTTLIKKLLSEWKSKSSTMQYLTTYDHLIKAECRNTNIKSFKELLDYLMPEVARGFKGNDLERVILNQKILVILDGLDELNQSSAALFEEVLQIKRDFGITVLITTRPEKLQYIEQHVKPFQFKVKRIQLIGVPLEKREELVKKYYAEIAKLYPNIQAIDELLDFLRKTMHRLADLWRLPYNLTLLTILWAHDRVNVKCISTAPELYHEIYKLFRHRLQERLRCYENTKHLSEPDLERIIDFFMFSLTRESLIGLKNNHINLPEEAYNRLKDACHHMNVPIEEMISAFLKRVSSIEIIYSFPHKGIQDFLAALYIWMELSTNNQSYNTIKIIETINGVLTQNGVPVQKAQKILRLTQDELKTRESQHTSGRSGSLVNVFDSMTRHFTNRNTSTVIRDILEEIHKSPKYEMPKFQNMLVSLIGMFYLEQNSIEVEIKMEALNLLQETGVRDRDAWITILNSVKCDKYVALFISKQPNILVGRVKVSDHSLTGYISLMEALQPPFKDAKKASITLDLKKEFFEVEKFLKLINLHNFKVKTILINATNFTGYTEQFRKLSTPLKGGHGINVDIRVNENLDTLRELMKYIKINDFHIMRLNVKEMKMEINDNNVDDYTAMLASMPVLPKNSFKGYIDITMEGEASFPPELLKEITRNPFRVRLELCHEFQNPVSQSTLEEKALSKMLKTCRAQKFKGAVTAHLKLPSSISQLHASVGNDACYSRLKRFFKSDPKLEKLSMCLRANIDPSILSPLPEPTKEFPSLYIPDLITEQDAKRAVAIARNLIPNYGRRKFRDIWFPRCRLSKDDMTYLLRGIQDLNMVTILFSSSCKPSSETDRQEVEDTGKDAIRRRVYWGIRDIDEW